MTPRSPTVRGLAGALFARSDASIGAAATAVEGERYQSIQALRFVAALMVICCHATGHVIERIDPDFGLYYLGANGVPLFFVISGFVMLLSARQLAHQPGGWRVFVRRRLVRIVPLYWLATTVKIAVALASVGFVLHARFDWLYAVESYLFIPAVSAVSGKIEPFYGVGWSLTYEMFFYLLVALCLAFRWPPLRTLSVVLSALALISLVKPQDAPPVFYYADPVVLQFLLGAVAAELITRRVYLATWPSLAAIASGLVYLFVPTARLFPVLPYSDLMFHPVFFGVAAFLVVYGAASIERVTRLAVPGWVLFLGAASYSLYLAHPIISRMAPVLLVRLGIPSAPLSVALSIAMSLIGGSLVYRFVEQGMTRALNRRTGGSRAAASRAVVAVATRLSS
jgi:peptidoglycan/LPS O-acetylase OafA/YrhL